MPSITVPTAILGSAAIGGGMSLIGGGMQAGAAKDAAQLQYDAAMKASQQQWQMFQIMQGNLQPFMNTGVNALNSLGALTGTMPANSGQISQIQQQIAQAQSALNALNSPGAVPTGSGGSMTPGMQAAMAYDPQSEHSSGVGFDLLAGWGGGGNMLESMFGANNRSQLGDIWGALQLNPNATFTDEQWAKAGFGPGGAALSGGAQAAPAGTMPVSQGSLGQVTPTGGAPATGSMPTDKAGLEAYIASLKNQMTGLQTSNTPGNPLTAPLTAPFKPTMEQLEATPGYQFTLKQGLKASQNAATAMGLGASGPAIAGAADYAAGLASQTYQQNFNNYWGNNLNMFNMLSGLASMGQNAAAGVGNAGIQTAGAMGNLLTGGASALGAGQVGAANAWSGAMNNVAGMGGNAAMLYAMSKNGLFGSAGGNPAMATYAGGGWTPGPGGFPEMDNGGFMGASGY